MAHNITKITLKGDDLVAEDNKQQPKIIPVNSSETEQIKSYLQRQVGQTLSKKNLRKKAIGRMASKIVEILRGKNRVDFFPNSDLGNFIVLTNAKHIFFTGDKLDKKKYYNHSGYPGGLRERTLREMLEKYPQELVFLIIKRMMKNTKL